MEVNTQIKIQLLRDKVRNNTITQEELREAITLMREDRLGSVKAAKTKAAKPVINSDDLLKQLGIDL